MPHGSSIPRNGLDTIRVCEIQARSLKVEAIVRALKEGIEIKVFQYVAAHIGTEVSNAIFVLLQASVYSPHWNAPRSYGVI